MVVVNDALISDVMRAMINRRWAKATPEQKAEQVRKMVAGRQRKARLQKRASAKKAKAS